MASRNWVSQTPVGPTGNDVSPMNQKHKSDQKTSEGPTGLISALYRPFQNMPISPSPDLDQEVQTQHPPHCPDPY